MPTFFADGKTNGTQRAKRARPGVPERVNPLLVAQRYRSRGPVWIIHTDSRIIHLSRRKRNYDGRAAATLKSASRRNAEADTATRRIKEVQRVLFYISRGGGGWSLPPSHPLTHRPFHPSSTSFRARTAFCIIYCSNTPRPL